MNETFRVPADKTWSRSALLYGLVLIPLAASFSVGRAMQTTRTKHQSSSIPVERISFDWNRSGRETTFTLSRSPEDVQEEYPDTLTIQPPGKPAWKLTNRDDMWGLTSKPGLAASLKQTKYFSFVSASSQQDSRIYLVLKGMASGCCVGSLIILTAGEYETPKVVFHETNYELHDITSSAINTLQIIGRSSDSEARALKNAQSYDPYRIYLLRGIQPATYDLDRSRDYTESHYCHWHGSEYDEHFVAVGLPSGASHCQVMSEKSFTLYRTKHPEFFQEP